MSGRIWPDLDLPKSLKMDNNCVKQEVTSLGQFLRKKLAEYNSQQTKEKTEMHSINALINLTDKGSTAELAALGIDLALPHEVKAALEKKMADQRAEAATEAAELILRLEKRRREVMEASSAKLKSIRRQEADIKKSMTEVNRAAAFGRKTMNYVPLHVKLFGGFRPDGMIREEWEALSTVPADFVVEETKPEVKAEGQQ